MNPPPSEKQPSGGQQPSKGVLVGVLAAPRIILHACLLAFAFVPLELRDPPCFRAAPTTLIEGGRALGAGDRRSRWRPHDDHDDERPAAAAARRGVVRSSAASSPPALGAIHSCGAALRIGWPGLLVHEPARSVRSTDSCGWLPGVRPLGRRGSTFPIDASSEPIIIIIIIIIHHLTHARTHHITTTAQTNHDRVQGRHLRGRGGEYPRLHLTPCPALTTL